MYCTKTSVSRIEERGHENGICSICGEQVRITATGRSIWVRPFTGGHGEVRQVGTAYCPKCDEEPKLPDYGTPIYEDQLILVETK